MNSRRQQRGYLLISVVVTLFLLAAVAVLLNQGSAISANTAGSELESSRADYVAEAGMQHALWRVSNNACLGDLTIAETSLGPDRYTATVTGAASGTSFNLSADQDAWIRNDDPAKNNNGADGHIRFEGGNIEHALTRFDLSTLPTDAQINSAVAWFYVQDSNGQHPEGSLTVHRVAADWTETGATWETIGGAFESGALASIPPQDTAGSWVSFNLTGLVQAWVNGQPNYGILMASTAEGVHAKYDSREASNPPRLEVVVGSGSASPVLIQAKAMLANGNGRMLARPNTVALQPPGTMVLQPDETTSADAYIWSWYKNTNFGNDDEIWVCDDGNNSFCTGLFAFDVAQVPRGSRILSATLSLHHKSGSGTDVPISAHRITQAWDEASATWNRREAGTDWNTVGGDFDSTAVATTNVGPASDRRYEWDITQLVQGWSDGSYTDYGVALTAESGGSEGETFYTSADPDPTRRPRLTVSYACECGTPCMGLQGSGRIALIGDDNSPDVDDQLKIALFESWGYDVDFYEDRNSDSINWNNYDVAYVSETVIASDVRATLADLSIGVVIEEPGLYDDLRLAGNFTERTGSSIDLVDASHYITSVFQKGPMPIYTGDMEILTADAPLAPDLQILATFGGDATLAAIDRGGRTLSGNAAGRRVTLPLGQHAAAGFDWANLDRNGYLLVQRAIAWARGADEVSVNSKIILSTQSNATLGGLTFTGNDLAEYDPASDEATLFLDGSLAGMTDLIDAVHVLENGNIILSTTADTSFAGLSFAKEDLIEYDPIADTATMYLEAAVHFSDRENVISVHILENDNIVLSTDSGAVLGGLSFSDKDLVEYDRSTGTASIYFNGDATSLSQEIRALHILDNGNLVFAPDADTTLGGLKFGADQLVEYDPVADTASLYFDGEALFSSTTERIWSVHIGPGSGGPSSPIAHWKLDETSGTNAVDSSGGNDGTLVNGAQWTPGILDGGLRLDGSDDRVEVGTFDVTGSGITMTGWFYADVIDTNDPRIISKADSTAVAGAWWQLSTSNSGSNRYLRMRIKAGGTTTTLGDTTTNLSPGRWYFAAGTYDAESGRMRLYLDGVEIASITHAVGGPIDTDPSVNVEVGANGTAERFFDGILDDVRVYDRELKASEIAELAERPPIIPIAHWMLDETSGSTAVDSVGNNDGSLIGSVSWTAGAIDGGLAVDYTNGEGYVEVPNSQGLENVQEGDYTLAAWFRPNSTPPGSGGDNDANYGILIKAGWHTGLYFTNGNRFAFDQILDGNSGLGAVSANTFSPGDFYHVAGVVNRSAGTMSLYVNGQLEATRTFTPGAAAREYGTEPWRLGIAYSGASSWGWPADGVVDDARIYDRALSGSDISELAAAAPVLPIAHWNFNEGSGSTATDVVGGRIGTLTNGPAWAAGVLDSAIRFDGSNDRINVPHDNGLNLVSEMTLSAWVNADSLKPFQMVMTKGDNGEPENYWLAMEGNRLNFGFIDGGLYAQYTSSTLSLQAGTWHHVAATFDDVANEVVLYVDGTSQTFASTNTPAGNNERLIIGSSYYGGEAFDGILDDVRIYDRVLGSGEIAALAGAGGGGGGGGPGAGCSGTFRDEFNARVYSNNDGTLNWATNWQETGESTSPTGGDIRIGNDVNNYQLQVRDDGQTVMREADLSEAGSATLSFDYRRQGLSGSSDYVAVDVSYNGGSNWTELTRFTGTATDSNYLPYSQPLDSNSLSANTRIRFRTPGSGMNNNTMVWFDNVQIACTP
ncbi:MAG: DNRLRE domain-containing protein [Woeseiaceae bacterium]|nr:DNRLRE domain-containing protein [Woeseiaceae bacterium]